MDPKTLKKHSQIARRRANNIVVTGDKVKTPTGFTIPGHCGKVFETYFETMLPGTASALLKHPKKDRVVRILAGGGFVILDDGKEPSIDKKIHPGDEVVLKAGVSYRFATTSDQGLELHISQEAKYDARLEVLDKASATTKVSADTLAPNVREVPQPLVSRRGSKASQQQASQNSKRVPSGQILTPDGSPDSPDSTQATGVAKSAEVMNARPSMGRFDEDGAG